MNKLETKNFSLRKYRKEKKMKNYLKRTTTFFLALLMLVSVPLQAFAEVGEKKINYDENPISDSGFKEGYINNKDIDVKVAKPTEGSKNFIEGPDIPDIYTMRAEFRIQRGDSKINNYQPYEASVGASIKEKEEDKKKIKQTINLPDFDGYTTPTPSFDVNYDRIVNKAKEGKKTEKNEGSKKWTEHKGVLPYIYTGKKNTLTVKHIFQSLENKNEYGPMDGQDKEIETTETGLTGSIVTISPLEKEEIKGYEPETSVIETQMPENTEKYVVEYRYNRKHFDVRYDTKEGTPIPTRTIYYGQRVPSIPLLGKDGKPTTETTADPTYKLGSDFLGWKPSIDLKTQDGKEFTKDEIIKDGSGNPIKNLDAKFIMPADHVTFTAVWKDKEKADYAVQFWTEKADHADNASILDKYEYMSTRVYKDADTGSRPNLDAEPVKGLKFPDLDQTRLNKIWAGARFNRNHDLFLNKFYFYNKDLTDEQNKDSKTNMTKTVSATGKTVYNIYYDRQVYDLYFTKSNSLEKSSPENTFYPEIWGRDQKKNELVKLGGPGDLYHYKARFNELMYGWPNDAMQTKGFTEGYQSFGWGPNYETPKWPVHLDTPPYRLNADQFLDMTNYDNWGGYTKHIDKGDGTSIDLDATDFTTLSFGIKQEKPSIPHHMDFWMDGFKDGETIIRYDLVRTKADTADPQYTHKYPTVTGFTANGQYIREENQEDGRVNSDRIDELNDEREEITPYPGNGQAYYNIFGFNSHVGELKFIPAFFSDSDEFGDPLTDEEGNPIVKPFKENGYLQFHYKRNKYPLRFNYDPTKIKDDSEFNDTNSLKTFYEFPLKALSPEVDENDEYKKVDTKEGPKNLIDNPENLQKLGLTDLVYTDPTDNKLKVKRPDNLPAQMVFKGWALDPAGTKLVWENPKETMPFHPLNLYAKWAEPDFKWKVTIDPNGGSLYPIKSEDLTKSKKTIQEGDIGQEEKKTYPEKLDNDGKKQIFTVIQRQQLKELKEPRRWGYDFLGWEWVKFNEDGTEDTSYSKEYKVPELYSFGNDIVSDVYLRAIWVKNDLQTVMAYHHILDKDLKEVAGSPESQELPKRRKGHFAAALGSKQGAEYTLVPKAQWEDLKQKNETFNNYYNEETGRTNNYFQVHEIKGPVEEVQQDGTIKEENNKENDFHFFYMPYRKREYKVNYLDERCKKDVEEFITKAKTKFGTDYKAIQGDQSKTEDQKREAYRALVKKNSEEFEKIVSKYSIIDAETVINGKRHYDARNYRHIPGWTLADNVSPQQQLFFDVDENTNEFLGINGTGLGEIFFFYQDARVIEVKNPKDPVPDGYVRVTFKIDDKNKGGVFKDKDNNEVTELYYDVIKGLKSDSLPLPGELGTKADGSPNDKEERKYYITPDNGKNFLKWDNKPLLNKGTILQKADNDYYVFTAYFDWSGLTSSGLVRTEAFKDPNGIWTNDFAPTINQLKEQLVWREKDQVKDLPAGTEIKLFDEAGNELTTDEQVYDLVNEKKAADKDELVRTVNVKAKVTFKDGKEAQELDIPITVYKNVYEALNKAGDKPLFLKEAEGKEAKDGGLKDVTGNYVKVTIAPTGDMDSKDNKVYYVNPKAWVEIPEVKADGSSTFINWTADQVGQNDDGKEKGKFDFAKRHKFTKDTIITPVGAKDVVEQEKGKDKPDVPKTYVKVIVKTTDKATDETAFEKTFWVNPTKEVTIGVTNPTGKTVAADNTKPGTVGYTMNFFKWETEDKAKNWEDKIVGKFEKDTTIIAKYSVEFEKIKDNDPTPGIVDTPKGKIPTADEIKAKLTPPEGKTIKEVKIVTDPDVSTPGDVKVKVIVEYTDGSSVGTNDKPLEVPVKVHEPIVKAKPDGSKPEGAMENYVKVIFKAGTGGSLSGDLVYYVSPEVEVDMTESAKAVTKTPDTGYFVNGEKWTNTANKTLKGTFTDKETEFVFTFDKSKDVVEKTDENVNKPDGYVQVTFKTDGNGKVNGEDVIIYYVNPKAGITLKDLGDNEKATDKQLAVPTTTANANYVFDKWQEAIDETTPITSERVHVAIFKSGQISLTYNKGGDDVTGDLPATVTVNYGETVGLANKGNLAKPNAEFAGWKLDEDKTIYQPGAQIKLEKARTATAQWNAAKHNVKFILADGVQFAQEEVEHGKTATEPTKKPTLAGKVFMGWKENASDENYFDFANTAITADKTLIAIWQDPVQNIKDGDKVEDQFIKVTFKQGDHGTLRVGQENKDSISYKVAKELTFLEAFQKGKTLPEIIADKYFKAMEENGGWDKERELNGQDIEFTAKYQPIADVIPVDPAVTDEEQIQKEKPEGMVLVTFTVPEDKAYMLGNTKFYVKKNEVVNIETPLVRRLELGNGVLNDYVFKGWDLTQINNEWKFNADTTIGDGAKVKPTITIRIPSAGDPEVSVDNMTSGATAYIEVTRSNKTTKIEAEYDTDYDMYFFEIPNELGGKLKKRDRIEVYAELNGIRSDTREYRVK